MIKMTTYCLVKRMSKIQIYDMINITKYMFSVKSVYVLNYDLDDKVLFIIKSVYVLKYDKDDKVYVQLKDKG